MRKKISVIEEKLLKECIKLSDSQEMKKAKRNLFFGRVFTLMMVNIVSLTNIIFAQDVIGDAFDSVINSIADPITKLVDDKLFIVAFAVVIIVALAFLIHPTDRAAAMFASKLKNVILCLVVVFCIGFVFNLIKEVTGDNGLQFQPEP